MKVAEFLKKYTKNNSCTKITSQMSKKENCIGLTLLCADKNVDENFKKAIKGDYNGR